MSFKTKIVEAFENIVLFSFVVLHSFQTRDCPFEGKRRSVNLTVNAEVPSSSDLNSCLFIKHNFLVCLISLGRLRPRHKKPDFCRVFRVSGDF